MEKIVCYKKESVERLVFLINGLKMPVLENSEFLSEIRKILESGRIGTIREEENGLE